MSTASVVTAADVLSRAANVAGVSAVGVVIPARDEHQLVGTCVQSVLTALRQVSSEVDTAVCVVADRCCDDTAARARAVAGTAPGVTVVENREDLTIGEIRDLAAARVLTALDGHRTDRVWLLSTDADSVVAPDWVVQHLRLARDGLDAVAGIAEFAGWEALPAPVAARYRAVLDAARRPDGHGNVYGANLGVRARAFQAAGGFGPVVTGEDHDLWRRLAQAGYRCRFAEEPVVLTSARRHGRACAGLATLLRTLDQPDDCAVTLAVPAHPGGVRDGAHMPDREH